MKKRIVPFALMMLAFVLVTLSSAQNLPAAYAAANDNPLRQTSAASPNAAVEIQFQQLHWLADDGSMHLPFSRVGVAKFSFRRSAKQLLDANGGGFLNVVTDIGNNTGPQWSVQNLYLSYRDSKELRRSHPTVQFGFPTTNGTQINNLMYVVTLTPKRLKQFPPGIPQGAMVQAADYLVGGVDEGGSGNADLPQIIGHWKGCADVNQCNVDPSKMGRILIAANKVPAVNEGKMGCAPAATARSIKYLLGNTVGDVQGIYEGLAGAMGTNTTTGTNKDNILKGKRKYTKDNKLKINSTMPGWSKSQAANAISALNSGADIELVIKWNNQEIGHVAMVTSITQIGKNQWQIKYVDDPVQGDGKAENQEHVIVVDRDGNFEGGKVTDLLIETKK